jgi:hypothetical protein
MKKIDLSPTNENILEMLEKDSINRNVLIRSFIEMVDYINENTSISIDGEWGTGKTFFVKQVIMLLNYYNKLAKDKDEGCNKKIKEITDSPICKLSDINIEKNFVPIYYNAWANDSHTDPILSLIFHIVNENGLNGYERISKTNLEIIASIADTLNPWSSGSISNLVKTLEGDDSTAEIANIENTKQLLKILFEKTLVEKGDKLIIFIDELDRCNPIYAVKLLERIKHFFDDDRIIFVFSTNINQLTNTISKYYGNNFNSFRYLNKFFDITFELDNVNCLEYMQFLGLTGSSDSLTKVVIELAHCYNLSMRDCNRFVQLILIVKDFVLMKRHGFQDSQGYQAMLFGILPVLLVLKIIDIQNFLKIINGTGYSIYNNIAMKSTQLHKILIFYMQKNAEGKVTSVEFEIQLGAIYNTIFNNDGTMTYESEDITLDKNSKKNLMEVVSLLKKELKYN